MREAVIVALGRSAVSKAIKGSLKDTRIDDVAAQVLNGVLEQIPQLDVNTIEDSFIGCVFAEAEQGHNIAKIINVRAGLPDSIPAQTINRFCSSGLQAIATAANAIISGEIDIAIAGGVESMTAIPMGGNKICPNPLIIDSNSEIYLSMGLTAENVAAKYNISREEQDEFSFLSHQKSTRAREEGKYRDEIIPIKAKRVIRDENGINQIEEFIYDTDECIRPTTSLEGLKKLRTIFKNGGSVTAASSSQMSDGVGMLVLMSGEKALELGIKPIAKFVSFAAVGVAPGIMGIGPIVAIPKALEKAKLKKEDIDIIELNEAFASQALACIKELDLDINKVNVNGGAISMGHPLGATGAILTVKAISELIKREEKFGLVSMCIGGGQGAAGVFELI